VREVQWDHLGKESSTSTSAGSPDETIETEVRIDLRGTAPASPRGVCSSSGPQCRRHLPRHAIPDSIKIDISNLHLNEALARQGR